MRRFCILFGFLLTTNILLAQDTWTLKDIELEMIKCPAGEFLMGSPKGEMGRDLKEIQHKVILSDSFMIGKYEVTQKQYKAVMGKNPSKFKNDSQPVELVNWNDAKEFCEKLNTKFSSSIPSGFKFDLPTEMQWEYACRAGCETSLNNGKQISTDKGNCVELNEIAWYKANSDKITHEVGTKKPNNWNIFDMHGNVAEWCLDAYNGNEIAKEVNNNSKCIVKGGAYFYEPAKNRSASRGTASPNAVSSGIGFRVALVKE